MNKINRRTIDWASFESELTSLINSYHVENSCDMPDFLISDMLCSYLKVFGPISKQDLDSKTYMIRHIACPSYKRQLYLKILVTQKN